MFFLHIFPYGQRADDGASLLSTNVYILIIIFQRLPARFLSLIMLLLFNGGKWKQSALLKRVTLHSAKNTCRKIIALHYVNSFKTCTTFSISHHCCCSLIFVTELFTFLTARKNKFCPSRFDSNSSSYKFIKMDWKFIAI